MPRVTHLIALLLAVSLLAAGCGGDDASEEAEDAQTESVSEVAASAEQPDTTVRDSAEQPEQPDADAQPEPEPVAAPVRLGTRFEWCVDIQRDWDWLAEIQGQTTAAEMVLRDAEEALEAATDELDRAEALQAFEAANRHLADLLPVLEDAIRDEVVPVTRSPRSPADPDDTEGIAFERAREAFNAAADPALVELIGVRYPAESQEPEPPGTTLPPEPVGEALSLEELLAQIEQLRVEVDGLWQVRVEPNPALENALSGILAAQSPSDAVDAYERFVENAQHLDALQRSAWDSATTAADFYRAARARAGEHLDSGQMSREDSDSTIAAAAETVEAMSDMARAIGYIFTDTDGWVTLYDFRRLVDTAREEATRAFILADTAAWTAYQASLSESCQP